MTPLWAPSPQQAQRPSQLSQGLTCQMIPLKTHPCRDGARGALQEMSQSGKYCPIAASPGTEISRPT